MKFKGAVFDMDGLMIDTEKLLMRFWIEAANYYGFDMKPEHVLSIRSLAGDLTEIKLKGIFGESFCYRDVRLKRIELMNSYIEKNGIEKKKGLDQLLAFLKENGFKIAVATATDYERTSRYLKSLNIFDNFDKIICASMVEHGKPAPDIYLKAAKELQLPPHECIALEDSPNGILSAYRAGLNPIMIPDLSEPDEETSKLLYACAESLDKVIELMI